MEFRYNGEHSIDIFNIIPVETYFISDGFSYRNKYIKYNTWEDFALIPTSRPFVSPPKFTPDIIRVGRTNNVLDITRGYGTKNPLSECSGEWEFIIAHTKSASSDVINTIYMTVNNRKCLIKIQNDDHYYEGRVYISSVNMEDDYTVLNLAYYLKPIEGISSIDYITPTDPIDPSEDTPSQPDSPTYFTSDPHPPTFSSTTAAADWILAAHGYGVPNELLYNNSSAYHYTVPNSGIVLQSKTSNKSIAYLLSIYSNNTKTHEATGKNYNGTGSYISSETTKKTNYNGYTQYRTSTITRFPANGMFSLWPTLKFSNVNSDATPISYFFYIKNSTTRLYD